MPGIEFKRFRRIRNNPVLRNMVRETRLNLDDLIYPLFSYPGENIKNEIKSMPGVYQFSIDKLVEECSEVVDLGIPAVILFGIPEDKDTKASGAFAEDGIVQRAIRAIKKKHPKLLVVADVCLCEYTSHGHCGMIRDGEILNDESLVVLSKTAVSLAKAGADLIAPSDMMDGRVGAIRSALDAAGHTQVAILAYSAKYASAFYGPFRDAVGSQQAVGKSYLDKRTYQLNPANPRESMMEAALDIDEGADVLMVKPAGAYLDILCQLRQLTDLPLAAYQVSGEYAQIHAAAEKGWLDYAATRDESLLAIKRAGANLILTYFAKEIAEEQA